MTGEESLTGVAHRRTALEAAMQLVEREAASPSASDSWQRDIAVAVGELERAVSQHISHVEAPGALLDEIVERAPRLQRAAEATRAHHAVLAHAIADLLKLCEPKSDGSSAPVGAIRAEVIEILNELARHRQDGADLIYEAFDVDIGGY